MNHTCLFNRTTQLSKGGQILQIQIMKRNVECVCVCVCVCSRDSSSRGERVTEGAALHGLRLQLHDAPPTDLEKHLGVSVTTQQPILPWQRPTSTATGLQPPHTDTQARGG